jgi:hypothetical protein
MPSPDEGDAVALTFEPGGNAYVAGILLKELAELAHPLSSAMKAWSSSCD